MIKNVVFDFGAVLLDWNPRHLFEPYFQDKEKCDYFLSEICPNTWNFEMDRGKPIEVGVAERIALFPEWKKEIRLYYYGWYKMIGNEIPGMYELECELKKNGYGLYGLTNWSDETFPSVRDKRVFTILDGMVVSGQEGVVKPEPEIYARLMSRYSLKPEDCVFVDDVQKNIDGALKAGMSGILFKGEAQLREALNELGVKISM